MTAANEHSKQQQVLTLTSLKDSRKLNLERFLYYLLQELLAAHGENAQQAAARLKDAQIRLERTQQTAQV